MRLKNNLSLSGAIRLGINKLRTARFLSPTCRLDCEVLLAYVGRWPREYLYIHPKKILTATQQKEFFRLIYARRKGIPVAYLVGAKEFFGRQFLVNYDVLIPRPITEELVEHILQHVQLTKTQHPLILDIGTGSGCIAITLKLELPDSHVMASDNQKASLALAQKNAHRLRAKVKFYYSDLIRKWPTQYPRPDMVVANLPYLQKSRLTPAEKFFIRHEPAVALFSPSSGLAHIKKLLLQIGQWRNYSTVIFLELETYQIAQARALARRYLKNCFTHSLATSAKNIRILKIVCQN